MGVRRARRVSHVCTIRRLFLSAVHGRVFVADSPGFVLCWTTFLSSLALSPPFLSLRQAGTMSRKQKVFELCEKVQRDLKLAGLPRHGCATDGTEYSSILAMWSSELGYGPPAVGLGAL